MDSAQGDLFAWATPRPRQRREGWGNMLVSCKIGPHWWFSPYLVIPEGGTGKVVPDLKSPLVFRHHQFRWAV